MTEKLFWADPYQREFSAVIEDQFPFDQGHGVILDRTCFYATSGGQPHDVGVLNGTPVLDVRFHKDRLIHVLSKPLEGTRAQGSIDWERRFDHMQQHTGQHILSAAFYRLFEAETSSFHLGDEYCSIELNRPDLRMDQVRKAEDDANNVIFSAQPVQTFFVDPEQAGNYPLRKKSDLQESLRIVQIGEFDLSPCSGTHVRNAGEVGPIFISGVEKLSQTLKVSFLCGKRVLKQFHRDSDILKLLSKTLTTSTELLPDSLTKLQDQVKDLRKELGSLKEEQWKREALELYASAEQWNDLKRIIQVWSRPYSEIRYVAQRILEQPSVAGALLSLPDKRVVFFKHPKCEFDLRPLFQQFLKTNGAKGGGPAHFMEAGGFELSDDFEKRIRALWDA